MDKTEVRTPLTAPISCPFESVVEGTAKKWRNNSYVPSIKCTSMWSPISFSESDVIRSGYEFGDCSQILTNRWIRCKYLAVWSASSVGKSFWILCAHL